MVTTTAAVDKGLHHIELAVDRGVVHLVALLVVPVAFEGGPVVSVIHLPVPHFDQEPFLKHHQELPAPSSRFPAATTSELLLELLEDADGVASVLDASRATVVHLPSLVDIIVSTLMNHRMGSVSPLDVM